MVAVKAADVDAFVARPDPARPVVLVFGPDAGLVSERVNALIKASVDDVNDPFALARLDGEAIAAEPTRLVDEAQTMPLFGGRRAVWVKAGSRNIAPAVEAVLALPAGGCRVVIEAGDLRRNAPLRALCERAKNAAALPCYADNERDRARLIDDEMRAAGLTLTPEARALLIPLLGGDRAASRSEIRKLALYAFGRGQRRARASKSASRTSPRWFPTLRRWRSTISSTRHSPAVRPKLEAQLAKARTAGTSAGSLLFAAQRHVAQLHKWRLAIEERSGFSLDAAMPPGQFRRKTAIEAALRNWTAARLLSAMSELADATLEIAAPVRSRRHHRRTRVAGDRDARPAQRGLTAFKKFQRGARRRGARSANPRAWSGRRPTFWRRRRRSCRAGPDRNCRARRGLPPSRSASPRHRTAARVKLLRTSSCDRRRSACGGCDFQFPITKLRAQHFGVARRQFGRDAVESAGQAVVDARNGRQRHWTGIADSHGARRADEEQVERQRSQEQPAPTRAAFRAWQY